MIFLNCSQSDVNINCWVFFLAIDYLISYRLEDLFYLYATLIRTTSPVNIG